MQPLGNMVAPGFFRQSIRKGIQAKTVVVRVTQQNENPSHCQRYDFTNEEAKINGIINPLRIDC